MNTNAITISLELLILNDLLQAKVIDAALFARASAKIMNKADMNDASIHIYQKESPLL